MCFAVISKFCVRPYKAYCLWYNLNYCTAISILIVVCCYFVVNCVFSSVFVCYRFLTVCNLSICVLCAINNFYIRGFTICRICHIDCNAVCLSVISSCVSDCGNLHFLLVDRKRFCGYYSVIILICLYCDADNIISTVFWTFGCIGAILCILLLIFNLHIGIICASVICCGKCWCCYSISVINL